MSNQRTHYVTTTDGVTIGGTVHGQGPPLVFVQGIFGDGDLDWQSLVPHLTDRFTCHLPSMRGRGLSGDHPDLSIDRQIDDLVAYVDSIGEPTGLVGWSIGASLALAVATRSDAVDAVAPYGIVAASLMDEEMQAALGAAAARTGELATEGKLAEAARTLAGWPFTDEDMAAAEVAGYLEATARYVPNMLGVLQEMQKYEGPHADDPTLLGSVSVPVLVLDGTNSGPFYHAGAKHVAGHLPNARIREIPGAGHAAPLTHPEALAEALTEFFVPAQHPSLAARDEGGNA